MTPRFALTVLAQDEGEHPIHLHGHQFWIVSTSSAPAAASMYAANYIRRDVVSVPAQGWARIRFVADNPGIWAMCVSHARGCAVLRARRCKVAQSLRRGCGTHTQTLPHRLVSSARHSRPPCSAPRDWHTDIGGCALTTA